MITKYRIKCLFGHHEYTIPIRVFSTQLICKHCRRAGHIIRDAKGVEIWFEYDARGREILYRTNVGYEEYTAYDEICKKGDF